MGGSSAETGRFSDISAWAFTCGMLLAIGTAQAFSPLTPGRGSGTRTPFQHLRSGRPRNPCMSGVRTLAAQEQAPATGAVGGRQGSAKRELLTNLFDYMDSESDGMLCEADVREGLQRLKGRPLTSEELAEIWRKMDLNADNKISTAEFLYALENEDQQDAFLQQLTVAGEGEQSTEKSLEKYLAQANSLKLMDPRSLFASIQNTDKYKERSRLFRRTTFTNEDWLEFRSSERFFKNLMTMFTSGVIRGLWLEVSTVTSVRWQCSPASTYMAYVCVRTHTHRWAP